jgi:hypothetical protein
METTRIRNGKTQRLIFRKKFRTKSGKIVMAKPGTSFPIWIDV